MIIVRLCFLLLCLGLPSLVPAAEWSPVRQPGPAPEPHPDQPVTWYRCYTKVPDRWVTTAAKNLYIESVTLTVRGIEGAYEVYLNGTRLDGAGSFGPDYQPAPPAYRRIKVPAGILVKGRHNTLAFRIYHPQGMGRINDPPPVLSGYFLETPFAGQWEYRRGDNPAWAGAALNEPPRRAVYDEYHESVTAIARPDKLMGGEHLPPSESLARMKTADDLEVDLVLSEPLIAQPLQLSFDARGRLWVVEYRQYPFPAGIHQVSRDKYYRAVYDGIPQAPPNHTPGADRISFHEDTDGDGTFDRHGVFLDGLNLATAVAHGEGGLWVMNTPYLLFYPDRNGDDEPDGPPEVHLQGFGMEDTHSLANSLCWGPDGWLYGAHGSTISSRVKRPASPAAEATYLEGPGVWRYHPGTGTFETVNEGGGNVFCLEWDAQGQLFSGYNGGNTRGFHYVPGGYYTKGTSGKYGPVTNPFAFGYLPVIQHTQVARFTHALTIYEGGALSQRYEGKLFCIDPLHRHVVLAERFPLGGTFRTEDLGFPLESTDPAFRPVGIATGPDGAIYIADFCEEYIAHGQNFQGQIDPTTGRVWRLRAPDHRFPKPTNLASLTTPDLVRQLRAPDKWHRQTALRLLAARNDKKALPTLEKAFRQEQGQTALEAFWALTRLDGLGAELALQGLTHTHADIRRWTVRLLGDRKAIPPALMPPLVQQAGREPEATVRVQMAATAKRLPPGQGLDLVRALASHAEDAKDPQIPLLLWWAVEANCGRDLDKVLNLFQEPGFLAKTLVRESLLENLTRRLALGGSRRELQACATLFRQAPTGPDADALMKGFQLAFKGRPMTGLPEELLEALAAAGNAPLALRVRQGDAPAQAEALELLENPRTPAARRLELIRLFGEILVPRAVPSLLQVVDVSKDPEQRKAALSSLQAYDQPEIGSAVVERFLKLPENVRPAAEALLSSRAGWADQLVASVAARRIPSDLLAIGTIDKLRRLTQGEAATRMARLFPADPSPTQTGGPAFDRVRRILDSGPGNPYAGKEVFNLACAVCHELFGEGGRIGPDLTSYQRGDIGTLLTSIVQPNAEIREGFENFLLTTRDGRTLNGFRVDEDNRVIVLRGLDGQNVTLPKAQVEELVPLGRSLMPDGLLDGLDETQVRDLFSYLRAGQPVNR